LFAKKHKALYGAACSSGTTAITLACRALGLGEGDEVIVPEFTMIASAWAVSMAGATPVFVDCGNDLNINPDKIEEKITSKTKAILVVHIYGRQCNMDRINKIAYEYGLRVIEDSCEGHGLPLTGDIACFSLFANKIITSGEGGICVTNDKYLVEQMKHTRGMAFDLKHSFLHKKVGYNFRMTNLQAAVALGQTERLDEILKQRKQVEKMYDAGLKQLSDRKDIYLMPKRDVVWMYDLRVSANDLEPLMTFLAEKGIETRLGFKPMSMQPMYMGFFEGLFAYKLSRETLYLPTFTDITKKEIDYVCESIKQYFQKKDLDKKLAEQKKKLEEAPTMNKEIAKGLKEINK
jgi:perosamine synthetase